MLLQVKGEGVLGYLYANSGWTIAGANPATYGLSGDGPW